MNVQRTYDETSDQVSRGAAPVAELPDRIHAIHHDRYGPPREVLRLGDVDRPSPGDGQVLLQVAAASLNPLDWHFTTGTPYLLRLVAGLRRPKQVVRGADVAGTVVEVGPGIDSVQPGDRVVGVALGSFAELAVARADALARLPESVSFLDAAAMPVAGVTALQALRDHARVSPGQRVLVNGAAGGVGTFAVQLAVVMGAEVTAVCSTRNVDMVAELGAHQVVDYTAADWVDGTEYDVIIDNVGNRTLGDCVRSLVDGGRYVMVSGPKDDPWLDPFRRLIAGKIRFLRSGRSFHQFTASESTPHLAVMVEHLAAGRVRSMIERSVPLADVPEALTYLGTGHARAKIVVEVAP